MDVPASMLADVRHGPRQLWAARRVRVAFDTVYGAVGVAPYLLGAVLLELTSPRTTFVAAGAGGLAATVAAVTALRR